MLMLFTYKVGLYDKILIKNSIYLPTFCEYSLELNSMFWLSHRGQPTSFPLPKSGTSICRIFLLKVYYLLGGK